MIRNSNAKISDRVTKYVSLPALRGFYGLLLSLGAPIGWILVQKAAGREPFSAELFDPLLYAYMSIATGVVFSGLGYVIGRREHMITDLALTDGLTGLYNKRYFKSRLVQEFERHQRYQTPMAVIQIDLDFFKLVNDRYGHQAGDEVLKKVSSLILASCRKNETAARVGGEEISIIAYDCIQESAISLAERIRVAVEEMTCQWQNQEIKLTASLGIALADSTTQTAWQIYQHADEALYQAKQSGRNKVCVYNINPT
jgi:diguanylate cyclase (GGDEF)-like protein